MRLGRDSDELERHQALTRRTLILGAGVTGLFGVLLARAYQLTVIDGDKYKTLSEENRINVQFLAPERGRILDRFGTELANNRPNFRVLMIPDHTPDPELMLSRLAELVPIDEETRARVLKEARGGRGITPVTVVEDLTWEQFAQVNLRAPDLLGLMPDQSAARVYPYGAALSHVLGYVDDVSERDLKRGDDDPLLKLPGFGIGKNGVELAIDKELRGKAGVREVEVNAHGRVIREIDRRDGKAGPDAILTLDMEVQAFAAERLAQEKSASCVVMDVHRGEILCLVSYPGYDPNEFIEGFSQARWTEMNEDELKPLLNKSLKGLYSPGSTFKMVVAHAALEAGLTTPGEAVRCRGFTNLGSFRFHCHSRRGHGAVALTRALAVSCDVYFYEMARRLGPERITAMAERLGLGIRYGFEVPGEAAGIMPTPQWKKDRWDQDWLPGDTFNYGIGQGYTLATPLQLAVMTARLCNGGKAVTPHIVRAIGDGLKDMPGNAEPLGLTEANLAAVMEGVYAATNGPGGTARAHRIKQQGMEMAGKTGTTQVRRITMAERRRGVRSTDQLPWKLRNHALYVAYAPAHAPRYAILVVVEHGGGGSKAAAPIARDVMLKVLERDPLNRPNYGPVASSGPDRA